MTKWKSWSLVVLGALVVAGLSAAPQAPSGNGNLSGMVTAAGKPIEGVAVSARSADKTFTTTVYTNEKGAYAFPALEDGQYKIWAQAVGFDTTQAEQSLAKGKQVQQNFTLKTLEDFSKQLSGDELIASLPGDTPQDQRMKAIIVDNCTTCHQSNFILQNRFDEKGWTAILNFMEKTDGFGVYRETGRVSPTIHAYKDELVSYLARVRGPSSTLDYKLVPRPSGAATQVVVTEYDLSPGHLPGYIIPNNGANWSDGTPSAQEARSAHDVAVDQRGNVWFSDQLNFDRTIGKLDPKTGKVTGYKLPGAQGSSVGTHGLGIDPNGDVWFTNSEESSLTKFDPKSEQFVRFPRPEAVSKVGGSMIDIDSKGNVWVVSVAGSVKLDPKTGTYSDYKSVTPGGGPYGMTVDAKDNGWFTQLNGGRLVRVDGATGKATELFVKPGTEVTPTDKDKQIASDLHLLTPQPDLTGPRRLGSDRKGDTVWVAEFYGDKLAKIDIRTNEITKEYALPHKYSLPYSAVVDKNHIVWVPLMNTDRVASFDPVKERFVEYLLPTRGTEARSITVDNSTDPPSVWIPYYRSNKIARVQVRTGSSSNVASVSK